MACAHPIPAYRHPTRGVLLGEFAAEKHDLVFQLLLPCGSCVGCQMSRARAWSIRCSLELQDHAKACWATLTYRDEDLPPTLSKRHLQLFHKRLRERSGKFRFFACGEYGETTWRPHYHTILFGTEDKAAIEAAWPHGFARVDQLSPAAIAYVAGYCAKKVGVRDAAEDRIDYATGEVYRYQPPFQLMSRRPGIGGSARQHWRNFRRSAIWSGKEVPAPRFYAEAYKANASEAELVSLAVEKEERYVPLDRARLEASEKISRSRLAISNDRRKL